MKPNPNLLLFVPALVVAALAASTPRAQAQQEDTFRFAVTTAEFESLKGASVRFHYDGLDYEQSTDSSGLTPPMDFGVSSLVTVELGEYPCTSPHRGLVGTTLGQRFGYDFAPLLTPGTDQVSVRYFQPLVRDTFVPYMAEVIDPYAGWVIYSFLAFPASVGELVSTDVVSNYLAYSAGSHDTTYHHGIVIRVEEDVELPEQGLALWIDRNGYPVSSPSVDAIYIGDSQGAGFNAVLAGPLNAQGYIGIHVTGILRAGDNLIALGNPGVGGGRRRSLPLGGPFISPSFPSHACPGDGSEPDPMAVMTDPNGPFADSNGEIPESSKCDATAQPDPPYSNCVFTGCDFGFLTIGEASAGCGSIVNTTLSQGWSGGVTVGVTIGAPEFNVTWTESGSVSGQASIAVSVMGGWRAEGFIGYTVCSAICDKTVKALTGQWMGPSITTIITHPTVQCHNGVQVSTATCKFDDC